MEAINAANAYWNLIIGLIVVVGLVFTMRERIKTLEEKVSTLFQLFNNWRDGK